MAKHRKKHHRRRHRRGIHGFGSNESIQEYGGAAAGAIASTMIAKVDVPFITDPNLKNAVPAVAGIAISHFGKKNRAVRIAGIVMAGIGIANLAKAYIPGLAGICGDAGALQQIDEENDLGSIYADGVGDIYADGVSGNGALQDDTSGEY